MTDTAMIGVLIDVSNSMRSAYALDRSHRANVERTHAMLTTLVNIVKREVVRHNQQESIFALAFGVDFKDLTACDLLALLDFFPYEIKGSKLTALVDLAKDYGAAHIKSWIVQYITEDEAGLLYGVLKSDRKLANKLIDLIPSKRTMDVVRGIDGAMTHADSLFKKV